jgi:hypothetical protein
VADVSKLELRQPGCAAVFSAVVEQDGGWPHAKLALIGSDPRILTHLSESLARLPVAPRHSPSDTGRILDGRDRARGLGVLIPAPMAGPWHVFLDADHGLDAGDLRKLVPSAVRILARK